MTKQEIIEKVESIANSVKRFKVGKTGKTVKERYDSGYNGTYQGIQVIFQSESKDLIDGLEEMIIRYLMEHKLLKGKLDNEQIGSGEMEDSGVYTLYIVFR